MNTDGTVLRIHGQVKVISPDDEIRYQLITLKSGNMRHLLTFDGLLMIEKERPKTYEYIKVRCKVWDLTPSIASSFKMGLLLTIKGTLTLENFYYDDGATILKRTCTISEIALDLRQPGLTSFDFERALD